MIEIQHCIKQRLTVFQNSDVGDIITRIIKKSTVIEELVLDGISLGR
jgi:hypothetical protein